MQKKDRVQSRIYDIIKTKGLKFNKNGFLETFEIENCLQIMDWINESDIIDDLLFLCLVEDVYYNLNAKEIQQRIGLESQCNGLRKTYGVVYEK